MNITAEEIRNRFGFHKASDETGPMHQYVRKLFIDTANELNRYCPDGREKACALTALQEAAMWTNAAIACNLAPLVDE